MGRLTVVSVATPLRSIVEATRQERSPANYVPQYGHAFEAAIQNHPGDNYRPRRGLARAEQARPTASRPSRMAVPEPIDLIANRPGEQLEAQITAALEAGDDATSSRPGFSGRRAYSGWQLGVLGEQMVADELDRLIAADPRWAHLNSIPVGTSNSDIDHLVVGPGGVFTINAKHHHAGRVWVGGDALMVNNVWQHYVRNSRHEAERAGKLLSRTAKAAIAVRGLIVPVGLAELTVKEQPVDVTVVEESQLVDFLISQPAVLDAYAIALVLTCARLSTTWRPSASS